MKVKPAPGLLVRDPISRRPLPPEGADVPDDSTYWVRRLLDGDVLPVVEAPSVTPRPRKEG